MSCEPHLCGLNLKDVRKFWEQNKFCSSMMQVSTGEPEVYIDVTMGKLFVNILCRVTLCGLGKVVDLQFGL